MHNSQYFRHNIEKIRSWLWDSAIPLACEKGLDRKNGGPVEQFHLDGSVKDPGFKRTRVLARQLYVYSHASILGFDGAHDAAHWIADCMFANARIAPGRWARRLNTQGNIIDETQDLYDLAFVMFAIAWYYRCSRQGWLLDEAEQILEKICSDLAHPSGVGYLHEDNATAPYHQNPHMHLTEALVVLCQVSDREIFRDHADQMVDFFHNQLIDQKTGILHEFFNEDWTVFSGDNGNLVEPGHLFEWSWILTQYDKLVPDEATRKAAHMLFTFANAHGRQAESDLTWDGIDKTGKILKSTFRCWPQTENLKALVARFERTEAINLDDCNQVITNLFTHYIDPAPSGLWLDHMDVDHRHFAEAIPTSSLYHIFLAFSEIMRVADDILDRPS